MNIFLRYIGLRAVRTAALAYVVFSLALTQVPLFDYLGYEFSAFMTLPAAGVSGILTLLFLEYHLTQELSRRQWLFIIADYLLINAALLLIPLVIISLNAFFVKNCSWTRGISYYFLLPFITMIVSVSLALAVGLFSRYAKTMYSCIVLGILSHLVIVTYIGPQLFAYNIIVGYFPGVTYDERLNDLSSIVLYREFTLAAALGLFSLFFLFVQKWNKHASLEENLAWCQIHPRDRVVTAGAVVCFAILGIGHIFRSELGFEYSHADLRQELGGFAITKHFTLIYPKSQFSYNDILLLKAEAEFHYSVVAERMNEKIGPQEKITVYLYPDAEVKERFLGSAGTNIARPWRKELHVAAASFEETFRHELVHVMAADAGLPVIKASIRMGLNEGLATSVDWHSALFTPHEYCAALQREDLLKETEALFTGAGFVIPSGTYAYAVTGSFMKYLIDRFGMVPVKKLFRSADFEKEFGGTLDELMSEWRLFLRTVDASAIPRNTVISLFFYPSIFRKVCARVSAEQTGEAAAALRENRFADAEKIFEELYHETGSLPAFRGLLMSYLLQQKYRETAAAFDSLGTDSRLRIHPALIFLAAEARWLSGDAAAARRMYRQIFEMNFSESYSEAAHLRYYLAGLKGADSVFRPLFYSSMNDSLKFNLLQSLDSIPLYASAARYMSAFSMERRGSIAEAARLWEESGKTIQGPLASQSLRRASRMYYKILTLEKAKLLQWNLSNTFSMPAQQSAVDEFVRRCGFVENYIKISQ